MSKQQIDVGDLVLVAVERQKKKAVVFSVEADSGQFPYGVGFPDGETDYVSEESLMLIAKPCYGVRCYEGECQKRQEQ